MYCTGFDRLNNSKTRHYGTGVSEPLSGVINQKETLGKSGVSSYFRRHEVALTRCHWQVI